jgi:hypothetical protein
MKFVLEIYLNNESMREYSPDIRHAINLSLGHWVTMPEVGDKTIIRDKNGTKVGHWEVVE